MRTLLYGLMAGAVLVGCGPSSVINEWEPAPITDAESLRYWSSGSAPQIYGTTSLIVSTLISSADASADEGCPVRTVDGANTTYTGNCTDANGDEWFGKLIIRGERDAESGIGDVTFEEFGFSGAIPCDNGETLERRLAARGTWKVEEGEAGTNRFNYDLRFDQTEVDEGACSVVTETQAISYSGTVEESGDRTIWNGSGKIGNEAEGRVEVSTTDEVLDSTVCANEAVSGTTTIKGVETAVISYDGDSDCSSESTITWTRNGEAMGIVTGISCTAASGAPFALSLLLLAGLRLRSRRR